MTSQWHPCYIVFDLLQVIAPKIDVKRPAGKKNQQFVFFFGSEN